MDLAKFAKMPPENSGAYLKFTASDNIKIVRFCYDTSEDIECRQKYYDAAAKKVVWDTPEGKWTMALKVAVYKSKSEFEIMTWDRSARFGADTLLPLFEAAGGKVSDTVYKITCQKAGTLEASYSLFPMRDSDKYAMPDYHKNDEDEGADEVSGATGFGYEDESELEEPPAVIPKAQANTPVRSQQTASQPTQTASAPKKKKNFWEE